MKKLFVLFSFIVLVFGVTGAFTQQATVEKQIVVEEKTKEDKVNELKDIENPKAHFKIELWTDRENATYKIGEEIVFFFKAQRDCRLTLFNIGSSGKVYIIFPNKHQKDNLIKAGKIYRIPPEKAEWFFKAKGPAGKEVVKAIATEEKIDLVQKEYKKPAGIFEEVNEPESKVARDIAIALKLVEAKKWAEAEKVLQVKE